MGCAPTDLWVKGSPSLPHQARRFESYHEGTMTRADLYLKVELDLDDLEKPERIAAEICRILRRVYGVRQIEVSSIVERD